MRLHTSSGCMAVAVLDEESCFTSVRTPSWWWPWSAAPPLLAVQVWTLLPDSLRGRITPGTWVYPCYTRLGMATLTQFTLL